MLINIFGTKLDIKPSINCTLVLEMDNNAKSILEGGDSINILIIFSEYSVTTVRFPKHSDS